jgi:CPA2 family monovalent cation:H+ antiporter-2
VQRLIKLLVLDTALVIALVIATAISLSAFAEFASTRFGVSRQIARILVLVAAAVLAAPMLIGLVRITRGLGNALAQAALPAVDKEKVDLAAAPRRALVVTLQLVVVLLVALPILALTQPFIPGWVAATSLALLLIVLGFVFWRSAENLQGHVKAGAEMIVEVLLAQAKQPTANTEQAELEQVQHLLPGLGEPIPLRLSEHHTAVGKTLAQLNLRGITGASVLAIARGDQGVIVPMASEVLLAGDLLALAGTRDAISAARQVLLTGQTESEPNGIQHLSSAEP